ncbi:MAG TPA: ferritin-like domain-containing protein [Terriglobales bacterium]|nr:ferritin-like domain-containing protein [Terriglobales bacterium]
MTQFIQDVEELRERARRSIEEGPVTQAYRGDKQQTIEILNQALATEIVCVLRYMHHYFMATGVHGKSVAGEFKEHADAEREHADGIAERIQQLGGKPDFNPRHLLERSAAQYVEGETLADMIREDLIAERVVIQVYTEMIRHFGDNDPTTRVLMEGILKDEEEHATDLTDLLYIVDPASGQTEGQDPGTRPLELHPEKEQAQRGEKSRGEERAEQQVAGRGSAVPPEHEPGTTGRPTRRRAEATSQAEARDVEADAQAGGSRAVHVTKPNRKRRVA